jgi:hypothetical protein
MIQKYKSNLSGLNFKSTGLYLNASHFKSRKYTFPHIAQSEIAFQVAAIIVSANYKPNCHIINFDIQ